MNLTELKEQEASISKEIDANFNVEDDGKISWAKTPTAVELKELGEKKKSLKEVRDSISALEDHIAEQEAMSAKVPDSDKVKGIRNLSAAANISLDEAANVENHVKRIFGAQIHNFFQRNKGSDAKLIDVLTPEIEAFSKISPIMNAITTDIAGGITVPKTVENMIELRIDRDNPTWAPGINVDVVQTGETHTYFTMEDDESSSWVNQGADTPDAEDKPEPVGVDIETKRLASPPIVLTVEFDRDNVTNYVSLVGDMMGDRHARAIRKATFTTVAGAAVKNIIAAADTVAGDANVYTTAEGTAAELAVADINSVLFKLKPEYRDLQNAIWVMHTDVAIAISGLDNGKFMESRNTMTASGEERLVRLIRGHAYHDVPDMDTLAVSKTVAAFLDLKAIKYRQVGGQILQAVSGDTENVKKNTVTMYGTMFCGGDLVTKKNVILLKTAAT